MPMSGELSKRMPLSELSVRLQHPNDINQWNDLYDDEYDCIHNDNCGAYHDY